MSATPPPAEEVSVVNQEANIETPLKGETEQTTEPAFVSAAAEATKETSTSRPEAPVEDNTDSVVVEGGEDEEHLPGNNDDGNLTLDDIRAAVDDLDENLDEAFGQAADTFWNFASSVTGKVTSVVKDQSGLEALRKNVTSRLTPLNSIGRDIQTQIVTFAPNEESIAHITGSVKSVAQTVQRNAVAMEEAILAKANDVGDSQELNAEYSGGVADLTIDDPSVGVIPDIRGSKGLDEIAKVGESVSNALGQTVGGLWSGLWGGEDDTEELARRAAKVPKTRFGSRLFELQANPDTYCEPAEDLDAFEEWGKDFNLDNYEEECVELLYTHDSIAELYERVVPRVVEEEIFWMRYFFAKHKLELEEERRKKLLERAENAVEGGDDEGNDWGDDDWSDDNAEDIGDVGDVNREEGTGEVSPKLDKQRTEIIPSLPETPAQAPIEQQPETIVKDVPSLPDEPVVAVDDSMKDKKMQNDKQVTKQATKAVVDKPPTEVSRKKPTKEIGGDKPIIEVGGDKPAAVAEGGNADDDWGDDDWE